ncbi:MAG: hypothetical protein G01um10148_152 [Parcubacteria group bacterium Gr01-1014_8]|nr:MAG: hypothetical protein G01um10148_152 [Parcubacteria group bacterium Gr01-1014_8]
MIRRYLPRSTEELISWYERYISPFSLLVGFTIDNLAIRQIDLWLSSLVLAGYLSLAAIGTILINLVGSGRLRHQVALTVAPFIPVVVQFAFGGLFSGFVILYSRSAAIAVSWVFVVLLAALLLGNERFRTFYTRFPFQIGILFFGLLSFMIFYVPFITKTIGPWMFVISGAVSVTLIALYLYISSFYIRELVKETRTTVARTIAGIFFFIMILYFLGAIPPLPLSLRDVGVLHSIQRTGDTYAVTYESRTWYEMYFRYKQVYHLAPGEVVYVYTAIFAPSGISTGIVHEWQKYDALKGSWVTEHVLTFPIQGGREGGYRGYSLKRDVSPGEWRVNVMTDYGQLIGRVGFRVEKVDAPVALQSDKF